MSLDGLDKMCAYPLCLKGCSDLADEDKPSSGVPRELVVHWDGA